MVVSLGITFSSEIHVLTILTKYKTPPLRPSHPKDISMAWFLFLDAYESDYGRSIQMNQTKGYNPECLIQIQAGNR